MKTDPEESHGSPRQGLIWHPAWDFQKGEQRATDKTQWGPSSILDLSLCRSLCHPTVLPCLSLSPGSCLSSSVVSLVTLQHALVLLCIGPLVLRKEKGGYYGKVAGLWWFHCRQLSGYFNSVQGNLYIVIPALKWSSDGWLCGSMDIPES